MADFVTLELKAKGKNALGSALLGEVREALIAADGRPLLLTGADGCFSAGLNLKEVATMSPEEMRAFLTLLEEVVLALLHHPAPTVAAVNGHAIAGGAVLARCCDVAIATANPRARIGLNEVAIGLRFPPRTFKAMAHKLPTHHHAAVLLGAALHPPAEALRLGLVDAVAEDCRAAAEAQLRALSAHPPAAYAQAKADLLRGVTDVTEPEAREFVESVVPVWTSAPIRRKIWAILGG